MKLRFSRERKLLRADQPPTVFKINLSDPRMMEIAGLSGGTKPPVRSPYICPCLTFARRLLRVPFLFHQLI
jgi:hypothetical protein